LLSVCSAFAAFRCLSVCRRYALARVALPEYSERAFAEGRSDFPIDLPAKVAWAGLPSAVPSAFRTLSRFRVTNTVQREIMARVAAGASYHRAACDWINSPHTEAEVRTWVSASDRAGMVHSLRAQPHSVLLQTAVLLVH
jgi:ABC-type proline/glycine betaine transport system substrate-binding protein